MKPSVNCDVEISITIDGEETIEHVPTCLQGAFLCTSGSDRLVTGLENEVTLPPRYTRLVNNCTDCEKERIGNLIKGDKLIDRERDLSTALKWLKQEMMIMKEQDKTLMKQFIHLRSRIVQLRGVYDLHSSNSDLSQDGSVFSLDDRSDSPLPAPSTYLANGDFEMTEFRERTTSLLSPRGHRAGPITRIRWKSHEYI